MLLEKKVELKLEIKSKNDMNDCKNDYFTEKIK